MRQGRLTLVIGLAFLAICIAGGQLAARQGAVWSEYVRESLLIAGWVAMWRPMQIYLHEWWPVRGRIRNFQRLSEMPIEVLSATSGT